MDQPLPNRGQYTAEAEAFQRCVAKLDAWPLTDPMTVWEARLMCVGPTPTPTQPVANR